MPTKTNASKKHWTVIKLLTFIATVAVAIAFVMFAYRNAYDDIPGNSKTQNKNPYTQELDDSELVGELGFYTELNRTIFEKDKSLTLLLRAFSGDVEVMSMDVMFSNPDKAFRLQSVDSVLDGYQTFTNDLPENPDADVFHVALLKENLTQTENVVLNYQDVAEVTFLPTKTGKFTFSLTSEPHSPADTNMLSPEVQDILGKVIPLNIYIGDSATLTKGKKVVLGQTNMTAELVSVTSEADSNPDCADCSKNISLNITSSGKTDTVTFSLGGFSAKAVSQNEAFGYIFEINGETVSSNEVELLYAPSTSHEK